MEEKMTDWFSGVTILLSLTIFLNTVSEIIPITSDSPLIGNSLPARRVCLHIFFVQFQISFTSCSSSSVGLEQQHPMSLLLQGQDFLTRRTSIDSISSIGSFAHAHNMTLGFWQTFSPRRSHYALHDHFPVSDSREHTSIKQLTNHRYPSTLWDKNLLKIWTSKPFEDLTCN